MVRFPLFIRKKIIFIIFFIILIVLFFSKNYKTKSFALDIVKINQVLNSKQVDDFVLNKSIENAIIFANKCASYSVSKFGTYVLTEQEINELSRN